MQTLSDRASLLAALEWQLALGADEAIQDSPVNRYALSDTSARAIAQTLLTRSAPNAVAATDRAPPCPAPSYPTPPDPASAPDLAALAAQMAALPTPLRDGARQFVFADGRPGARVMIVGEAPGRDEDIEGLPFVGRAGQLLDRMLAAIGLSRRATDPGAAVYITNVLPWRPPNNRTAEAPEIAQFLPFLARHIALADPDIIVLMGNTPCQALLGPGGITRIRGQWTSALGKPVLPMVHPAYLLRTPAAKREAWADLLALKARLTESAA